MSKLPRFLQILFLALTPLLLLSPCLADEEPVWKRSDFKSKLEKQRAEGRGKDIVEWTTSISPSTLPEQLKVGDRVSFNVSVNYSYGGGADGKSKGRPKTLTIRIRTPADSKSEKWHLVPNYCGATPTEKPMARSGTVTLSATERISKEQIKKRSFRIGVSVTVSEYCWHQEAGGQSGLSASYRLPDDSPWARPNSSPDVRLTVNDPDRVLVPGQRARFTARVSDDRDSPKQLKYRWERIDLATGNLVKAVGPTRKRRMFWTPDTTGRFRIRVTVSDRDGAKSRPASLDIEVAEPSIEGLKFSKGTRARHRVRGYWDNRIRWTLRRGEWSALLADLKHYHPKHHILGVLVDGKRIKKGSANDDRWVGKNGGGNERRRRVLLFIPPKAAVGPHQVEVVLERRKDKVEIARKTLKPELFVLFNPLKGTRPDPSVNAGKPMSTSQLSAYALGIQDFDYGGSSRDGTVVGYSTPYNVSPYDKRTILVARDLLKGMPTDQRRSAAAVARHFARGMRGILEGRWTETYPPGTSPWQWDEAGKVCAKFKKSGKVRYGQCFIFGMTLDGLLRSVGIPNRMVTVWGSGHDQQRRWGLLERIWACKRWRGTHCREADWVDVKRNHADPTRASLPPPSPRLERWGFHVWNELWIPRINPGGGWALSDGTYGFGTESRAAVRAARHQPIGSRYDEGNPTTFVFSETNLPFQSLTQASSGAFYRTRCANRTAYHAFVTDPNGSRRDIWPSAYGAPEQPFCASLPLVPRLRLVNTDAPSRLPRIGGTWLRNWLGALNPVRDAHAATLTALYLDGPDSTSLGKPMTLTLRADGGGPEPVPLAAMVLYIPRGVSGGGDEVRPQVRHFEELTLTPGASTEIRIPADAFERIGHHRIEIGGLAESAGPTVAKDFYVEGVALTIELPETMAQGGRVPLRVRAVNPLDRPLDGVKITLSLSSAFSVDGPAEAGPQTLAAGAEMVLETKLFSLEAGRIVIQATAESTVGPSSANATIQVSGPPLLSIDAQTQTGLPVGTPFDVTIDVINEGLDSVSGLTAELGSVPGIELTGRATQSQASLGTGDTWTPTWSLRADKPGAYEVTVSAKASDSSNTEKADLLLVVGSDDPDGFVDNDDDFDDTGSPVEPEEGDRGDDGSLDGTGDDGSDIPPEPAEPTEGPEGGEEAAPGAASGGEGTPGETTGEAEGVPGEGTGEEEGAPGETSGEGEGTPGEAATGEGEGVPGGAAVTGPETIPATIAPTGGTDSEPNNRISKATPIGASVDLSGTIDPVRDIDWYHLKVGHQGELKIRLAPSAGDQDLIVRVWNDDIDAISGWLKPEARGAETSGFVDLPRAGDYWLEVRDNYDDAGSASAYRLSTRFTPSADRREPNNKFGDAAPIPTGTEFPANILPVRDIDWYRIDIDQHGQLELWIEDVIEPQDLIVRVWNANKDALTGWYKPPRKGATTEVLADLPAPGPYWLEVRDNYDDARAIQPYRLRSTFTPSADRFEPNNSFALATDIEPDGTLPATILPVRDIDWYVLNVDHHGELRVDLTEVQDAQDLILRVWTGNKDALTGWYKPEAKGADTNAVIDLPSAGRYWLEVRDNYDDARAIEPYRLTSGFTPSKDQTEPNNRFADAAVIKPNDELLATILPLRDIDWYAFEVPHHGELRLSLTEVQEALDLILRVWTDDKDALTGWYKPERKGADTTAVVDLPDAGHYWIEVRDNYDDARAIEPYRLTSGFTESADRFEPNNSFGKAKPLSVGSTLQATILPRGDIDWYRLDVGGETKLSVLVDQVAPELDIVVRVWNADRRAISGWFKPEAKGGNTEGSVQLPEAGRYRIEVRDNYDDARTLTPYRLKVGIGASP